MLGGFTSMVSFFVLMSLFFAPIVPTIPSTAVAEYTYPIPTGHLCMRGEEFHTLSDDVYGTHTDQGVYNEYIVTSAVDSYCYYHNRWENTFSVCVSIFNYVSGDQIIIEVWDSVGTLVWRTSYKGYHIETPRLGLLEGIYVVKIGFHRIHAVPASYRVNMG